MRKPLQFGKYLLLDRINVGGMAEVFRAKIFGVEGFERYVAIKRILPSIAEDAKFIEMFIDEAKITVQLQHANIAQIETLGKIDDSHFIAMEFIDGKDIKQIFEYIQEDTKRIDIGQACYIITQVCSGLDYAHKKRDSKGNLLGIVHRDVSPQNIRISYDGEVKIIDFGIAKAESKSSKTEAGILKGKFAYMSPEQVRGRTIDRRSDIFAIGIVFYELLTGTRLFQGESDFSTLEQIRNTVIEAPRKRNPDIPKRLEEILMKALSSKPSTRYQYAIELHDDLQKFMILNDFFYSRSDLSKWMREIFSKSLKKDQLKLAEYERTYGDEKAKVQEEDFELDFQPNLEWDDDELETAIFDKSPSFIGEEPEEEPKKNKNLANILEEKRRKKKSKNNKMILLGVLLFALLIAAAVFIIPKLLVDDEILVNYKIDLKLSGTPRSNLNVFLNDTPKAAGINLPYLVKGLNPGSYKLKVDKPGYKSFTSNVSFPILTSQKIEKLKTLQSKEAKQKFGITYADYNKGILDLDVKLELANLKRLIIKTEPTDVNVYINEKEVSKLTPYETKEFKFKDKISLQIEKDGYQTIHKDIEVTAEDIKQNKKEFMFTLQKAKLIKVKITTPRVATLFIDGEKIVGSSPYSIELQQGKHKFKIKSELFPTVTKEVDCTQKNNSVTLTSKQKFVYLTFNVIPDTSIIFFDKAGLKSSLPLNKLKEKKEIEKVKKIKFEKKGFDSQTIDFKWNKKGEQTLTVKLKKTGSVKIVKKKKKKVKKAKTYGYLSMMSIPNTNVKIDGVSRGKTPLVKFKLTTGRHKISLTNSKKGISDSFWVTIKKGVIRPLIKRY